MKWPWKAFGLYLAACLALGLALAYTVSSVIDARRGPGAPDSTVVSMALGGFLAPLFLAILAGWKGWTLKPLLVAGGIASTGYSGNPGLVLGTLLFAALGYYAANKVRAYLFFCLPSKASTLRELQPKDDEHRTPIASSGTGNLER